MLVDTRVEEAVHAVLAGQALAAGFMAINGVALLSIPFGGVIIGSPRMSIIITILVVLVTINAVNFVDGLDGLAIMPTVMVGGAPMYPSKNIVQNAVNSKDHTTLVAAVKAAGLVDTLQGPGPFTVFAPTDEAFAKVPKAQLDALLKDKAALTKVLTYHVVPGKVMAADVKAGKVKTVEGSELTVSTTGGVKVDKANVVKTDIAASNGVIHVIDAVLLPVEPARHRRHAAAGLAGPQDDEAALSGRRQVRHEAARRVGGASQDRAGRTAHLCGVRRRPGKPRRRASRRRCRRTGRCP